MTASVPRCRRCHAEIYFVRSVSSGKPIPLDPFPHPEGNVAIEPDGRGRVLTKIELATTERPLYRSHFATCAYADEFRNGKR